MGEANERGGAPIWLVGMMGVGKSTVGRHLAELLGRTFFDADREIEARAGATIPQIFEREGEAGFRARERETIEALADGDAVIALGGGAVSQESVRERIASRGIVVYLRADIATLLRRVGRGRGRPLLAGLTAEERRARLQALLSERSRYYEEAAVIVDSDGLESRDAAQRVARALRVQLAQTGRAGPGDSAAGGSDPSSARR